ncbi:MAG TPA: hypothetical protein VMS02_04630, partial [Solirubrobacteraceae bacterium]|nr:hypothetical protein [Solirubrobacteraceae bacterium]
SGLNVAMAAKVPSNVASTNIKEVEMLLCRILHPALLVWVAQFVNSRLAAEALLEASIFGDTPLSVVPLHVTVMLSAVSLPSWSTNAVVASGVDVVRLVPLTIHPEANADVDASALQASAPTNTTIASRALRMTADLLS